MSPLVPYEEQKAFLELADDTDQELIESLLNDTTKLFEKTCGRENAPFDTALTNRTEIHEGSSGSRILTLDYPIASVTSIVLGRDVAAPDETLIPTDAGTVVWRAGSRDLIRTDGGVWRRSSPRWVKVVYNTLEFQPADVKLVIKQKVALIYNGLGKQGFASVTRGSRSWTMADPATVDKDWDKAINNHSGAWFR